MSRGGDYRHAAVVGEGEACWATLLDDAANGMLNDIYASDDNDFDLADAPMPAFEMLDVPRYNRLTVQTSRGCPHRCEFCAASVMLTGRYKQKPVSKVLAEIDRICTIWQHPFIEFADDNTFVDKAYWKDLLPELAKRRIKWFAETDLSVWKDESLLSVMRQSGCAQLLIGLESPVEAGLAGLDLRGDWKHKHFDEYTDAIATIQGHGITVNGCFVIGLDGHTTSIFDDVFEFVRASGLYEVQVTIQTPFPGTPLYERLQSEGRLLDPAAWARCTLFDVNYRPKDMTIEQLTDGFRQLVVRLYGEEFTRSRRDNFKKILARSRARKGDLQ